MCRRLGWDMNLHQLRRYSATELISAGVDVRTVAGRLGHGGGGTTTLRVYSAWRSEADQRAAGALGVRMPAPPVEVDSSGSQAVPDARPSMTTPLRIGVLRSTCVARLPAVRFVSATHCRRWWISLSGTAWLNVRRTARLHSSHGSRTRRRPIPACLDKRVVQQLSIRSGVIQGLCGDEYRQAALIPERRTDRLFPSSRHSHRLGPSVLVAWG
jgi:hypothetical protein